MRHFIAYHNAKRMGHSCADIPDPRVQTARPVSGLEGVTVWLVAGEGQRPKSYFLCAKFLVSQCEANSIRGSEFPNVLRGKGRLFGTSIPLDGTKVLLRIQKESANFARGLFETRDLIVMSALSELA